MTGAQWVVVTTHRHKNRERTKAKGRRTFIQCVKRFPTPLGEIAIIPYYTSTVIPTSTSHSVAIKYSIDVNSTLVLITVVVQSCCGGGDDYDRRVRSVCLREGF